MTTADLEPMDHTYKLTISCPDRIGIVSAVSSLIARENGWIKEANHYADVNTNRFFMRNVIRAESLEHGSAAFVDSFRPIAEQFEMDWKWVDSAVKKRVVILVSKFDHCLYDLLHRWHNGEYDIEIPCVISNHPDLRKLVEFYGIKYVHVPVTAQTKTEAFARIGEIIDQHHADTIVLARYMQIFPPALCTRYSGRIINIHHSFLPSFMGAKPYHQAFERGVKLIGATCHYVTSDLDQGPIIEQDVVRIDHGDTVDDLVGHGRDVEKAVLARGLKYHFEDRVLLDGVKTVVFR